MKSPELTVNPRAPRAAAVCDRCQVTTNHYKLREQMEWRGDHLVKTGLLVCRSCLDKPSAFLQSVRLPPDPVPIREPRAPAFIEFPFILMESGYRVLEESGVGMYEEDA